MTLNISPAQNSSGADPVTRSLVDEVIDELTSWNPREFIGAFRRWHRGALSLIHLNVLSLLEAEGPLSMSRLAEALDVSVASVTGIIDRMEAKALVTRSHDESDRRVVLVHPAPGGVHVFRDIDDHRRKGLAKLLTRLNERELEGLLDGHRALRAARASLAREMTSEEGPR